MPEIAGFWSYVQADHASDHGRILSLAQQLRDQYRLLTAEELAIFVDRESIEWGSEWSDRIDDAIAGTTFFIPIVTPSYFKSQACRNELLKFSREASRLGLHQLLMPVYWVAVPELQAEPESSEDEAVKLVARYEWQDLRELRLEDESSSIFRKAVSRLAEELATRTAKMTEEVPAALDRAPALHAKTPNGTDLGEDLDDDGEPGILDKAAATEEGFPVLAGILEELFAAISTIYELVNGAQARMEAANARQQSIKARLVLTESLARALHDPTETIAQLGRRYAETLSSLDRGVHAMLDAASGAEDDADWSAEDEAERLELLRTMQELAKTADTTLEQFDALVDGTRQMAKLSRALRAPLKRMRAGLQGILDGRALIEEWGRRATEIEGHDAEHALDHAPEASQAGQEPFETPTYGDGPSLPGVDLNDNRALRDLLDEDEWTSST